MEIENQNQNENENNLNVLHLQLQMHAQQRRRKTLLVFLTIFSLFYLVINFDYYTNPQQYQPTSTNSTNQTTEVTTNNYTNNHENYLVLKELLNLELHGEWNYEDNKEGKVKAKFYQQNLQSQSYQLFISLYKGWFLEDFQIEIIYGLNESSMTFEQISKTQKLIFTNISTYRYEGDIYSNSKVHKCPMDLEIIISDSDLEEGVIGKVYLQSKSNCDEFSFETVLEEQSQNVESKALFYSLIVSMLNFIQIVSCLKIMRDLMFQNRSADQYSLFVFVFLMICDGYLGVLHFYLALQSDYFITPAFLQLILFGFLELKIAMFIWKERYINAQDNNTIRRELYKFYLKFYAIAILLIILFYNFIYYNVFLILVNLYLIPQIIHIAKSGQYVEFDFVFVFGLICTRLFIPLYFRGCPENVLETKTSFPTCTILILLTLLQIYVYYLQCTYGPRCFLPNFLKPKTHQYFIDQSIDGECAVCMSILTSPPTEAPSENKMVNKIINLQINKTMMTPCGHYFHVICLTKWMQVKMNCPTCRQVLPPII